MNDNFFFLVLGGLIISVLILAILAHILIRGIGRILLIIYNKDISEQRQDKFLKGLSCWFNHQYEEFNRKKNSRLVNIGNTLKNLGDSIARLTDSDEIPENQKE